MHRRSLITAAVGAGAYGFLNSGISQLSATEVQGLQRERRNVLLVMLAGGMSQLDTFDHKPEAPSDIRGEFGPIRTKTRRDIFSSLCPKLAAMDDKFALMRAMFAPQSGDHGMAYAHWLYPPPDRHLMHVLTRNASGIPCAVSWSSNVFPTMRAEYQRNMKIASGVDILEVLPGAFTNSMHLGDAEYHSRNTERMNLRRDMERSGVVDDVLAERFERQHTVASRLLTHVRNSASKTTEEEEARRDRYGRNTFGDTLRTAGRLADPDFGNAQLVIAKTGHWDFHEGLEQKMKDNVPDFDQALAALIEEYGDRLIICVRGEFGRTPWPEGKTKPGRDHFPIHTGMFAGPPFHAVTHGKTSKDGRRIESGMITNKECTATLLVAAGVQPVVSPGVVRQLLK